VFGTVRCGGDEGDRAVSPVVGVVLMVAVTVLLAAVVGVMALGVTDRQPRVTPYATFDLAPVMDGSGNTNDRPYVEIVHEGAERIDAEEVYVVDHAGNEIRWDQVWTGGAVVEPGEYVHVDGYGSDGVLEPACEGTTYRVVWRPDDAPDQVLGTATIDSPAVGPAATHC
jgi:flagellin-like protein